MGTKRDSQNVLRDDIGQTTGGQYATEKLGENSPDSLNRAGARTKPLPSEILSAAAELDLERLELAGNQRESGEKRFTRMFAALEAHEMEHGTWKGEKKPEWFSGDVSQLTETPGVSAPRDRGSWLGIHNDEAVVVLHGRFGGGNRECYCDEGEEGSCTGCQADQLSGIPGYITDEDDDGDSTYGYAYFRIEDEEKRAEATRILKINELAGAARCRDRLAEGAPIWTFGERPSRFSWGRKMTDIVGHQNAVTSARASIEMHNEFKAGTMPDEESVNERLAGQPQLRRSHLISAIKSYEESVARAAIAEVRVADLEAPLDAGLLTGEPEKVIREQLGRAQKDVANHQEQAAAAKTRVGAAIWTMGITDTRSFMNHSERESEQKSIWALSTPIPNDFRKSEYFIREMTEKVKTSPGFDTLDEAEQERLIDWAVGR